ncbi:Mrp/NBP35 family ATP-binding protein [Amphiplicatus metriothermophilus]|uniref:Iron-sulfur cluster carrier protein n=1 Tax=Amphiplicatus metriothermophilus TaxID=1519374 RepID=A0A239PR02_9PROT|nr:Mrp/NBP35 family ATP-binding protein [Amphiplicatus metriothermophilus]MBB5518358.1 ATP-binding protein involved in chromosome partitioning [Amphiplicatus metriothermophilus]SNT72473.1 ATP-binding protein involved in chromosome partitioning [Amphiplicatus metriothermophilus]
MANDSLTMRVRAALSAVANPRTGRSIVADGLTQGLTVGADGAVRFAIEAPDSAAAESLLEEAKRAVAAVEGVTRVSAVATAHRAAAQSSPSSGGHDDPLSVRKRARIDKASDSLPGVRNVIAVASGKGGVGKSTIAANLAVAFAERGLATGLLDADIYGPSLPTLFGLKARPALRDGKIVPLEAFGVKAMSIGLLVDPDKALAWRGPMVMGAVRQLMGDVDWGALDVLVIDTPPGTGDAHLTLAQSKKLTGAVIVSTPQELALADVRRGVALFRTVNVPILGVIENMAWLEGPDGTRSYLFGRGGAERSARELDAPFLGFVPIFPELREASDTGAPLIAHAPDSPAAAAIRDLADKLATTLNP